MGGATAGAAAADGAAGGPANSGAPPKPPPIAVGGPAPPGAIAIIGDAADAALYVSLCKDDAAVGAAGLAGARSDFRFATGSPTFVFANEPPLIASGFVDTSGAAIFDVDDEVVVLTFLLPSLSFDFDDFARSTDAFCFMEDDTVDDVTCFLGNASLVGRSRFALSLAVPPVNKDSRSLAISCSSVSSTVPGRDLATLTLPLVFAWPILHVVRTKSTGFKKQLSGRESAPKKRNTAHELSLF
jgi:hypothetical protein